jgi:hypothetical protein
MNIPKNRSMPLTAAMARFVDVADLIKSRIQSDDALHDLCEDYHLARQLLAKVKKEKPKSAKRIAESAALVEDLEDEIIRCLLGA